MRVIAGKHRGRILAEFKGREVRPTSDRAKEALFNILQGEIYGSSFLDLFCGTGSIGIEAISRGAEKVTFVDCAKESVKITEKNLAALGEKAKTVCADASAFVSSAEESYDIIFLDPPYNMEITDLLYKIAEGNLLAENGVLIYEHEEKRRYAFDGLVLKDSRRYGIAKFDFYIKG